MSQSQGWFARRSARLSQTKRIAANTNRRAHRRLNVETLEARRVLHHAGGDDGPPATLDPTFDLPTDTVLTAPSAAAGAAVASTIPALSSLPSAQATVYLDFLGYVEPVWGFYSNITTPVFDLDGDATSFSTNEITAITRIWQRVSEDFAPFNINVTTVNPFDFSNGKAVRVSIGGSGSWTSTPVGGIAYIDSFTNSYPNSVFVFPNNLSKNEKSIAEAASHEAGHAFGLHHQSLYSGTTKLLEYNPGANGWAPIMGNSYGATASTWSNGQSSLGSTVLQDDMTVISRSQNGFGYRADDHPATLGGGDALTINGNQISASGVIERMTDVDAFTFSTGGGAIVLNVNTISLGANLDSIAELYNSSGVLIASSNPSNSLNASISTTVPTGNYTLLVKSTGVYGYVGQYTVSGTINAGLYVSGFTPAADQVVAAPPTDFVITLSDPVTIGSVNASDLFVNGIAADEVTINDSQHLTFHFNNSPVSSEGLQTLTMSAGALTRDSDANPLRSFSGTFRYDPTPLSVTSIAPTVGSTATLPLTTLVLNLNGTYAQSSVSNSSLVLDRGFVTGVTFVDPSTIAFSIAGLSGEGPLGVQMPAGAITDLAGNPSVAYSTTLDLDFGTVPYTTPLTPLAPLGGGVYDPVVNGTIGATDDFDNFTLAVPAGQLLSVKVGPSAGTLQPQVTIYDPNGQIAGLATAAAVGGELVFSGHAPTIAGTYTISIGGANNSTGGYQVQVILNAALEQEPTGGTTNNTPAGAQNLDTAFVEIGGGGQRAAVLGKTDAPIGALLSELEPNNTRATADIADLNFLATPSSNLYHLFLSGSITAGANASDYFRLGALQVGDQLSVAAVGSASGRGTLGQPRIDLYRDVAGSLTLVKSDIGGGPGLDSEFYRFAIATDGNYVVQVRGNSSTTGTYHLNLFLENSGAAPNTGGTVTSETEPNNTGATANDLSTSWRRVQYTSQTTGAISASDVDYHRYQFQAGDLVTAFVAPSSGSPNTTLTLYNSAGTSLAVDNGSSEALGASSAIFSFRIPTTGSYYLAVGSVAGAGSGNYQLMVNLSANAPPAMAPTGYDNYAFTLNSGEIASLAIANLSAGQVHFELTDALGTVLSTAAADATNATEAIARFAAPASGVYYVRVWGDPYVDYNLVLTRSAIVETESNDALAGPHATLDGVAGAAGWLDANRPTLAGNLSFAVDSLQSTLTMNGTLGIHPLYTLLPQLAGSMTTQLGGTLVSNVRPLSVSLPGGSQVSAIAQPGPFIPGSGAGVFATQITLANGLAVSSLFQNLTIDLSSALLGAPLADMSQQLLNAPGGTISFPASSLLVTLATADYTFEVQDTGGSSFSLAGLAQLNQASGPATLSEDSGVLHLMIPVQVSFSTSYPGINLPFNFTLTGQVVAEYELPPFVDPIDYYEVTLKAGQTLHLGTSTALGDGSGLVAHDLDPQLVLLTPAGSIVATDDNSASDGRNALLDFVAQTSGTYRIGVVAQSGRGDYVLHSGVTGEGWQPGDANHDNQVNGLDYVIWADHFGQASGATWEQGDFNSDGAVDGLDYVLWSDNFGLAEPGEGDHDHEHDHEPAPGSGTHTSIADLSGGPAFILLSPTLESVTSHGATSTPTGTTSPSAGHSHNFVHGNSLAAQAVALAPSVTLARLGSASERLAHDLAPSFHSNSTDSSLGVPFAGLVGSPHNAATVGLKSAISDATLARAMADAVDRTSHLDGQDWLEQCAEAVARGRSANRRVLPSRS